MKKYLLRAAAVILLLLVFFIVYLQVRQYRSFKSYLHRDACTIIRINADGILKTLALDFVSSPSYYMGGPSNTTKHSLKDLKQKSGIDLPANIFIYTLGSQPSDTWFCTLPLNDTALLKVFLSRSLHINSFKMNNGVSTGISTDKKLAVAFNDQSIAICYSLKEAKSTAILADILAKRNMMQNTDERLKKLKLADDHITVLHDNDLSHLNFKKGEIVLNAAFGLTNLIIPPQVKHRALSSQNSISMWLSANFKQGFSIPTFKIKDMSFNKDSLLSYFNGYADLELRGLVNQQDTVINYDYNDNFEQVEHVNINKKQVPGIYLSIKTNPSSHYLKQLQLIDGQGLVSKKLFPLYNLYANTDSNHLQISTTKDKPGPVVEETSGDFFFLNVDFDRIAKTQQLPILKPYIESFGIFSLKARKTNENKGTLSGNLSFKNKSVNALGLLGQLNIF